jgi:hypothetical protein
LSYIILLTCILPKDAVGVGTAPQQVSKFLPYGRLGKDKEEGRGIRAYMFSAV